MTRRRQKSDERKECHSRSERIAKLLKRGWIKDASEIPEDAIPVNPDSFNAGGSYSPQLFYRDQPFTCKDCGKDEIWKADDQRWYFEKYGAPWYQSANRCLECRIKERERKREARKKAGHEPG
ncbi:MAG: hypothetical protein EOP88_14550 [Verrucomicrobiaceae bacterium]|nr:MAG: hypothetical protein EOP88_14550 [Verrucomicrobiaceae bacterium]